MKNSILKTHFFDPKNIGTITNPTYKSVAKSKTCNDLVKMTLDVHDNIIKDIKVEIFGCGYSIAGASYFTEIAKGKKIHDVQRIVEEKFAPIIDEIPVKHRNCVLLSNEAFKKTIDK